MKKNICILLVAAMVFAGCSGKNNETSTQTPANETLKTENMDISPDMPSDPGSYFPLAEPINITMAGTRGDGFTPYEDVPMFKEFEEKTNIHITWIDWPAIALSEKKNLAFASGELPDALYGSWILSANDVVNYGSQGLLQPLDDFLNEDYMPNFAKILNDKPEVEPAITTPEGSVYALPTMYRINMTDTHDALIINTDWLEKVNKDIPTTTDEFFDVLMAFKEAGDLNENGKDDEIPFSFRYLDQNNGYLGFIGFTGMSGTHQGWRMSLKDDTPVFTPAQDEFKEALIYLNKLHVNGLLDQEVFTMDGAAYNAKTQSSTPMVGVMGIWSAINANKNIPGNDPQEEGVYVYMEPLKGYDDVEPTWLRRINPYNSNFCFAISTKSKYTEELVRWADLFYDVETSIEVFYGPDGEFIKKVEDGVYEELKTEDGKSFTHEQRSTFAPANYGLCAIFPENFKIVPQDTSPQGKAAADKFYAPFLPEKAYDDSGLPTADEGERMSDIAADLFSYVDQSFAKFVTEGNVEEGWDNYITQLEKLGVDEYVQIKTDIYNRLNQ